MLGIFRLQGSPGGRCTTAPDLARFGHRAARRPSLTTWAPYRAATVDIPTPSEPAIESPTMRIRTGWAEGRAGRTGQERELRLHGGIGLGT